MVILSPTFCFTFIRAKIEKTGSKYSDNIQYSSYPLKYWAIDKNNLIRYYHIARIYAIKLPAPRKIYFENQCYLKKIANFKQKRTLCCYWNHCLITLDLSHLPHHKINLQHMNHNHFHHYLGRNQWQLEERT